MINKEERKLSTTLVVMNELGRGDPRLGTLFEKYGCINITLANNFFESLVSSIVGQQLSNKVAEIIWNRFVKLLKGTTVNSSNGVKTPAGYQQGEKIQISPQAVMMASVDDLRAAGLSFNKIKYVKNLSQAVIEKSLDLDNLQELDNEMVIKELTKIKGIGRWTAEMFLIFSLGRHDVFSLGDVGLYNAIKALYDLAEPSKFQLEELSKKWAPYRTFASLYLWKSLENTK